MTSISSTATWINEVNLTLQEDGVSTDDSSLKIWVTSVILSMIFLLISMYFLTFLVIDACRNDIYNDGICDIVSNQKYWCGTMTTCRLVSVACGVVIFTDELFVRIAVDNFLPELCQISKLVKVNTMCVGFLSTYAVLWVRQKMIYQESTVRDLRDENTRMVSAVIPILLIGASVGNCVSYVLVTEYGVIDFRCGVVKLLVPSRQPWIISFVTLSLMQVMLLWLFHQPLRKNELSKDDMLGELKPVLQRGFYATLGCSISDSIGSYLAVTSEIENAVKLSVFINVSVFTNVMMVVVSYINWKETLFPWRSCINDKKPTETVSPM